MFIVLSLCVMFFFFKQKTAYEMRISDWSSDVCSSDLEDLDGAARERKAHRGAAERRRAGRRQEGRQDAGGKAAAQAMRRAVRLALRTSDGREDRKSVVKGKGVSVRVDIGGLRSITKKNKQIDTY